MQKRSRNISVKHSDSESAIEDEPVTKTTPSKRAGRKRKLLSQSNGDAKEGIKSGRNSRQRRSSGVVAYEEQQSSD